MKKFLIATGLLCLLPIMAFGHPGKTDKYGGHKCIKDCEEWGLFFAEYHLHDKDWKPIRISRNKKTAAQTMEAGPETSATATAVQPDKPKSEIVTTYRYITTVYEESIIPPNPLLFILLILLLLLLILRMNRKKEETEQR